MVPYCHENSCSCFCQFIEAMEDIEIKGRDSTPVLEPEIEYIAEKINSRGTGTSFEESQEEITFFSFLLASAVVFKMCVRNKKDSVAQSAGSILPTVWTMYGRVGENLQGK